MPRTLYSVLVIGLGLATSLGAQDAKPAAKVDAKVKQQAEACIAKGANWLLAKQNGTGSWGEFPHPAIAALCGMALHQAPGVDPAKAQAAVAKALAYVLTFKQDDGSIYPAEAHKKDLKETGNYPNYTTSIALLFLATVNRPEDLPVMVKARQYLQGSQFTDKNRADYGGIGYGKTGTADLSNVSWATEALRATEFLDKEPYTKDPEAQKKTTAMWTAMQDFLAKCQSLKEVNPGTKFANDGGFVYSPEESKAGETEAGGKKVLRSYGSMTYAGLMAMLHARLQPTDVRVKAALKFLGENYVLAENPGMGAQGHYYYLLIMAKALNTFGQDQLTDAKGVAHPWREDVIKQVAAMQNAEAGTWANANGRWMESMPELATPYAILTLKTALGLAGAQPAAP